MQQLKSISEVCGQLGTTSRTVRYYEQLGLITTVQDGRNTPRRLDEKNIERLRKILFLRRLGLSLKDIGGIIASDSSAAELIRDKRAGIYAEIAELRSRIRLLEEVMAVTENGGDIYAVNPQMPYSDKHAENEAKADKLTQSLLDRNFDCFTAHSSQRMKELLPANILEKIWNDTISPCGRFVKLSKKQVEANTVTQFLQFEKLGLSVRFVFHDGLLSGLWFDYYYQEEN